MLAHSARRPSPRFVIMIIGAIMLTALALLLSLIFPQPAHADSHPGGNIQNPVILNIDIARPAVVRIFFGVRDAAVTPHVCAAETGTFTESKYVLGGVGSGTFISSHGDILTANHVVNAIPGTFEAELLEDADVAPSILADIKQKCGENLSDTQLVNLYLQNPNLFSFDLTHTVAVTWLDTSYVGSYAQTTHLLEAPNYTFQVLGAKPTFTSSNGWGDDVAIIHLNGFDDTPSVPIGDSGAVSPTDQLTLIGYPGNGDINHYDINSPQFASDFLTESINFLTVSAIKSNDIGGTVIQTGGNTEHGDSGGPALNAAGQIVGIDSFANYFDPTDPTTYDNFPDGTGFLQASSSVTSLLQTANIDVTPGTFETMWRQALTDFAATSAGHWHKAVTELTAIQSSYPKFKGADDYLTYAQAQAQNESSTGVSLSGNTSTFVGLGLAGLAVIALIIVLIVALANRRKPTQPALVPVAAANERPLQASSTPYGYPPQNYPPSGYPSYPPQSGYGAPSAPPPPAYGQSAYGQPAAPPPPAQQVSAPSQTGTCVNGHPMQANEVYCSFCGAARAH